MDWVSIALSLIERFGLLGAAGIGFGLVFYRYINGTLDDRGRISKGFDNSQSEVISLRKENDKLRGELLETRVDLEREKGARALLEYQNQDAVDGFLEDTQSVDRDLKLEKQLTAKLMQENKDLEERLNDCGNTITILQNIIKQRGIETKAVTSDILESEKEFKDTDK